MLDIIEEIYNRMAGDSALASLVAVADGGLSGPAIYDTWTHQSKGPYITFTIVSNSPVAEPDFMSSARVQIDIWDRSETPASRRPTLLVRNRLATLFDKWYNYSTQGEATSRSWLESEGPDDEDQGRVRRWRMDFMVRFYRRTDAMNIL